MTNRTRTLLIVFASFLVGAIVSGVATGYASGYFITRFFTDSWMLGNVIDTEDHIKVLRTLREGKTEKAREFLEESLNTKILGLHLSDENSERTNRAVVKAIEAAREYRTKYPHSSRIPEVDEAMEKILQQSAK
jgi:hypothetical protein